MSKPSLSKKFLDQMYDLNILDPEQDPMKQFQEMQDLQLLYDNGDAPMEYTQDPDEKNSQINTALSSSTASKQSTQDCVQNLFADRARRLERSTKDLDSKNPRTKITPSSSMDIKQSAQDPVQTLFADRARRLETVKKEKEKEATEKAQRKAEALAKKEATSRQQGAAMSKQAKYAAEEKERLKEEKMAKERVLKQIEVDKVERKEREERRKEAVRAEADNHDSRSQKPQVLPQSSRGRSYGTNTIGPGGRNRPNTFTNRAPSPPSSSRSRSVHVGNNDRGSTNGDCDDGEISEVDYTNDDCTTSGGNHKSGGRSRPESNLPTENRRSHPVSRTHSEIDDPRNRPPYPSTPSGSSRPFSSEGIRLGGPRSPPASSYSQLPSSLTTRPVYSTRSNQCISPRASTSRSSRPFGEPRRKTIERFDEHESAREVPTFSSDMHKTCPHPPHVSNSCSHCDRGGLIVCMPCVVRGCKGRWCVGCWDAMVARKRAVGARVTRPPGWQECKYRPGRGSRGGW